MNRTDKWRMTNGRLLATGNFVLHTAYCQLQTDRVRSQRNDGREEVHGAGVAHKVGH